METEKSYELCRVRERRVLSPVLISLTVETTAPVAAPGQFAMLRGPWGDAPLLPRAISYHDAGPGWARFLFRTGGPGTDRLGRLVEGDPVAVAGPLGNGFPVVQEPWLVAGGIGLPPLAFYRRRFGGRLFWGVPTREATAGLAEEGWALASDDGTLGVRGTAVDLVAAALQKVEAPLSPTVLSCGPYPMMAALARLCAAHEIPCFVSLEGKMACGVGVCCGCAHPAKAGGYVHVCEEGPVFSAHEVVL